MISVYHKDAVCSQINETNKEETKTIVLYDYSQHGSNLSQRSDAMALFG
jgi:hypothetical protein